MHVKFQGGPLINDHGPQKKIKLVLKNITYLQ